MMKRLFFIQLFIGISAICLAQPRISNVRFESTAEVYGLYEICFDMGEYPNPYDPDVIDVYAEFFGPNRRTCKVIAFYYEGYTLSKNTFKGLENATPTRENGWKVRFTPDAPGEWSFTLHATDAKGNSTVSSSGGRRFFFRCKEVDEAKGFIRKANAKYLKREVFAEGERQYRSFFPIGPNIAWYSCYDFGKYKRPYGVYEYERYIDSMAGNCNYMRIWLNRYQFLSLYGPEHTLTTDGLPTMYFDATLNQKDAAELDHIFAYALEHDINLMPCIFNFRNFIHKDGTSSGTRNSFAMPSDWVNNPYHTILGLDSPYQFFTDDEAVRITKNLIRYIVARWGYATNIVAWELWNEVVNMANGKETSAGDQQHIAEWHSKMATYLQSIDPYQHLITTSMGTVRGKDHLFDVLFKDFDIVQRHNYQNIMKANPKEQFSQVLYQKTLETQELYPTKPFFMGEFAFSQSDKAHNYLDKDPHGFDLHNSLWSSLFSGSMGPASFWYWEVMSKADWFRHHRPMNVFCEQLPVLSESFTAQTTGVEGDKIMVFPNGLETYYLVNAAEDTLIGWSQDDAYSYQSLRRLTDQVGSNRHFTQDGVFDPQGYVYTKNKMKKPLPTPGKNLISIPIENQPVGTLYTVRWFDAETGEEMTSEATTIKVQRRWFRKRLQVPFPDSVRDLEEFRINNTYGDAVFMIYKD